MPVFRVRMRKVEVVDLTIEAEDDQEAYDLAVGFMHGDLIDSAIVHPDARTMAIMTDHIYEEHVAAWPTEDDSEPQRAGGWLVDRVKEARKRHE